MALYDPKMLNLEYVPPMEGTVQPIQCPKCKRLIESLKHTVKCGCGTRIKKLMG